MRKRENVVKQIAKRGLCAICKGTKNLCGKKECPLLVRYYSLLKSWKRVGREIYGSSPPGVFVGRYGYPKVRIGPLVPPNIGNTEYMDIPELWIDMDIKEFVGMRSSLVRGMRQVDVNTARDPDYRILQIQEFGMAERHIDSEVVFEKRPKMHVMAGSEVQPFGLQGKMEKLRISNVRVSRKVEKVYYDDMKTTEAVLYLYREGIKVSSIQRAFSAGILGVNRKFVPTRWSITAVDDMIGKELVNCVREYETVEKSLVFKSYRMGNIFVVIFLPFPWSYELVEAWYPGTLWNPHGNRIFMVSSHEFYEGRSDYAEIGGCYYSARLACAEKLVEMKKQARVVVLREAQPAYLMPVGVWQVRENVRNALRGDAMEFDSVRDAVNHALSFFHIPKRYWFENSKLLYDLYHQRRIEDFEIH